MKQYQLLIFDWDGTVMDSTAKIVHCIRDAALELGLEPPKHQDAQNIIGLSLVPAMQRLFPQENEAIIQRLIAVYSHHFVTVNQTEQGLFVGVREGLARLSQAGVVLAVATGKSRRGLDRILDALDMRETFMITRCADETRSKPHPAMLYEILDCTSIAPQNALMIGDTTFDLDMASNANMDALGVSYGAHSAHDLLQSQPVHIVDSFVEMMEWLLGGRLKSSLNAL